MPIILGPDGPSLGGFVCPATIVQAELWKIGQLKAGDTRALRSRVARRGAPPARRPRSGRSTRCAPTASTALAPSPSRAVADPARSSAEAAGRPAVVIRQDGDANLLVEYGPLVLDLGLRFRVHALMQAFAARAAARASSTSRPGIRSLQVHYDDAGCRARSCSAALEQIEGGLPATDDIEVASRIVHLPLSWDDPATRLAIEKYMQSVRPDAPWCPSNIEFIRRINGLDTIDDVQRIVFDASYLVLGLGDVYLGAPVATPLDPRHRLVTTKYNPARTWTPENAVGIGGAYLCVYGMEGPGGYQFVGRTCQMWNRFRETPAFPRGKPWLLRFFDQIRFYPVGGTGAARVPRGVPARPRRPEDRGDDVPLRRLPGVPGRQRGVDRRVPGAPARGVRRRARALGIAAAAARGRRRARGGRGRDARRARSPSAPPSPAASGRSRSPRAPASPRAIAWSSSKR